MPQRWSNKALTTHDLTISHDTQICKDDLDVPDLEYNCNFPPAGTTSVKFVSRDHQPGPIRQRDLRQRQPSAQILKEDRFFKYRCLRGPQRCQPLDGGNGALTREVSPS
jgi:hypothetical protein